MNRLICYMKKNRSGMAVAGYFLLAAFLLLMLATRSSFLYICNDWDDTNSYFTMGKALMNGYVPYRDIFDQKGIWLYFFYGLAYLISNSTYTGVYILEIVEGALAMYAFYKIIGLYTQKSTALVLAPCVYTTMIASYAFYWGGSAEEMMFPILAYGLYMVVRYFKKDYPVGKTMSSQEIVLGGFLAGMIANIKFIDLGFYFAWMMCIFFAFLALKDWKGGFLACFKFLGGLALPFVPWLIYFAAHKSLYWWYYGTIYINVFVYSNLDGEGPSFFARIYDLAKNLYFLFEKDFCFFLFLVPGVLWYVLGKGKKWLERFTMIALCFFLYVGIYIGGMKLGYYAIPLAIFAVFGFAGIGVLFEKVCIKIRQSHEQPTGEKLNANINLQDNTYPEQRAAVGLHENHKKSKVIYSHIAGTVAILLCMVFIGCTSMNIPAMKVKEEDHFLFQFKKIVDQTENPTLLTYNCFDTGLGTICHAMPAGYWFQSQTIPGEEQIRYEQKEYMWAGIPDYIICETEYPNSALENYQVVAEGSKENWGHTSVYYLLKKK